MNLTNLFPAVKITLAFSDFLKLSHPLTYTSSNCNSCSCCGIYYRYFTTIYHLSSSLRPLIISSFRNRFTNQPTRKRHPTDAVSHRRTLKISAKTRLRYRAKLRCTANAELAGFCHPRHWKNCSIGQ